jgi:hypothetical protein
VDWKTLIAQNASALIGFTGAIIGVAVGAIISFLLQYQQRRWVLDDQLRQWKRQSLTEHTIPIRNWINETFRMLRTFQFISDDKFGRTAFADAFSSELQEQYKAHASFDATLYPHITALGDEEIIKYCEMFRKSYLLFIDVATKKDINRILEIQTALVGSSTLINRRIDALFEETFANSKRKK